MNVKETSPLQWAAAVIGENHFHHLRTQYEKRPFFRFTFISAALLSQVIGLLLVCFLGIVIGSALLSFLR